MLEGYKKRLRKVALVLSTALLLSPLGGLTKAYAAQKQQQAQQTQQQQAQQTQQQQAGQTIIYGIDVVKYAEECRLWREIDTIYKFLSINREFLKRENKGLDTKEVCIKRKSLEERVEKILNGQLNGMLIEMYPTQNKPSVHNLDIDIVDVPPFIVVTDRNGKVLYEKVYYQFYSSRAFSGNILKKLKNLAEFLGPDAVEDMENKLCDMSDEGAIKKIDEMIEQAKKDNNGKLERKYRAYTNYLGGYVRQFSSTVYISNRTYDLSLMMVACGHEYGHILHAGFPISRVYEGEQRTLRETICDLLGDETSWKYAQKYLQKNTKRYKEYEDNTMKRKTNAEMWKGLIEKVDKLLSEGEIDKAEGLMNETAAKYGISEINQAGLAVAKLYYTDGDEKKEGGARNKLEYMLKELNPDYFVGTTKYATDFNEVDYAYRLIEDVNKMDKDELKKKYVENREKIKELIKEEWKQDPLISNYFLRERLTEMPDEISEEVAYFYGIPHTWELRKEFMKKNVLLHELYERLPEKEAAEVIQEK